MFQVRYGGFSWRNPKGGEEVLQARRRGWGQTPPPQPPGTVQERVLVGGEDSIGKEIDAGRILGAWQRGAEVLGRGRGGDNLSALSPTQCYRRDKN